MAQQRGALIQAISAGAMDKVSIESVASRASGRANSRFMVKFLSVLTPDLAASHWIDKSVI